MSYRNFFILAALPLLLSFNFTSCEQATGTGDEQLTKDLALYEDTWYKVMNQGKIEEINAVNFTEDVTAVMAPDNIVGLEEFKAYYQEFLTGFSDINFEILDAYGQGDKIVKHWRFRGKHTGVFFGIPATGNDVDLEGATLVQMRDGRIAQEQDILDNMAMMQQLGVVSDPGNTAVIDAIYRSFASGDIPAVLGAMDAEIAWREAEGNALADGNPYIGPDAVLKGVFTRLGEEHEYFKLKDIELHDMSANQVLATLRYDAKRKSNGNLVDAQAAHLWTLKDGKITAFQQYVDTRQLAEAAGK
ncbi:MAG: ester cyclase [Saprospiraceae bacterium]